MASRFSPIVALFSMLTLACAGITGCTSELDAEAELALDDESEDADEEFRNAQVSAVANDPAFRQLLDSTLEMTTQRLAAQALMSDGYLDAYANTITEPGYMDAVGLNTFMTASGMDPNLITQQRTLINSLISKYDLQGLTQAQRQQLFAQAASTPSNRAYIEGKIEYELNEIEGEVDTTIDDCEAVCLAAYAVSITSAFITYVSSLAAATAAGPLWPVLAGAATATYAWAIAEAESAKDNCIAVCNGEAPTDAECVSDSDCAPDGFCWKGVLGIGENECRPLKEQSDTCSRHGQCESGCCKLHIWTNPISKTCRPASACN